MDLSIIIVNLNTRILLEQCLYSVYSSITKIKFEVWVVDNASYDGSQEMVRKRFPQVRMIENTENLGFARANNQALRLASGRYSLLLNSDAIIPANGIDKLFNFMVSCPRAGAAGPLYINEDGSFQASFADFPNIIKEVYELFGLAHFLLGRYYPSYAPRKSKVSRTVDWIPGTCFLVNAEAIRDIGYLDEDYFFYTEEMDWCYRMRQRSWKVWFYPEVAVTHKMSQSAKKNPENSIRYLYRGKLRFFCKHYGIRQGIFLKWLMFFSLYLHGSAVFAGTFFSKKGIKAGKTYFALAEIIKSSSLIENKDI